jgi:hypothetical protein
MKRFLTALIVAALLAILAIPALAGQGKPYDPTAFRQSTQFTKTR